MHKLLIAFFVLFPLAVSAQDLERPADPLPSNQPEAANSNKPDAPDGFDPGGVEINIITDGDKTIEEYSLNGQVYMVKIQQKGFAPYYLIDRNGDGRMDEQVSELMGPGMPPPNWVLFRW